MPAKNRAFLDAEDTIIADGFAHRCTDAQLVVQLAKSGYVRSASSVGSRRANLGLMNIGRPQAAARLARLKVTIDTRVANDRKFKLAMLAAIKSGAESAILGVVKDRRPFALHTIHPEPQGSCCGSSAALCLEIGGREMWG